LVSVGKTMLVATPQVQKGCPTPNQGKKGHTKVYEDRTYSMVEGLAEKLMDRVSLPASEFSVAGFRHEAAAM
jgi:hypothetical protein